MKRGKIEPKKSIVSTSKTRTKKRISRGKRKIRNIEVEVQDTIGNRVTCAVPILITSSRVQAGKIKSNSLSYKVISTKKNSTQWKILNNISRVSSLQNLVDKNIVISNGKNIINGKVVNVKLIDGGGATSPPTADGLPPIDE